MSGNLTHMNLNIQRSALAIMGWADARKIMVFIAEVPSNLMKGHVGCFGLFNFVFMLLFFYLCMVVQETGGLFCCRQIQVDKRKFCS